MTRLIAMGLALTLASCASNRAPVVHALQRMPPEVTHVVVTLDVLHRLGTNGERLRGECVRLADGTRWVVLHLGELADLAPPRDLIVSHWVDDTLLHELDHARRTCTNDDHDHDHTERLDLE